MGWAGASGPDRAPGTMVTLWSRDDRVATWMHLWPMDRGGQLRWMCPPHCPVPIELTHVSLGADGALVPLTRPTLIRPGDVLHLDLWAV